MKNTNKIRSTKGMYYLNRLTKIRKTNEVQKKNEIIKKCKG